MCGGKHIIMFIVYMTMIVESVSFKGASVFELQGFFPEEQDALCISSSQR